jgi:hypothetical protein
MQVILIACDVDTPKSEKNGVRVDCLWDARKKQEARGRPNPKLSSEAQIRSPTLGVYERDVGFCVMHKGWTNLLRSNSK